MRTLPIVLLTLTAAPAFADAPPSPPKMAAEKIRDNFWLLTGPGGNIAFVSGPETAFLIDDQIQPMTPALKAEIAKATKLPIRFVVNTHWHGDHTGGNQGLAEGGSVVLAHDNVRKRLSSEQFVAMMQKKVPAAPPSAWPILTFTDSMTLHLNGDDIEVIHVPPAHTDGDSIVFFHKANVIHTGDTYVGGYPFIDRSTGGHIDGFLASADKVLALANPTTRIIPGHGPVSDRAGLKKWIDGVRTIRDRIAAAIQQKKTLAEVKAAHPSADFDAQYKGAFIQPDTLVETIYDSLSSPKK
jgi:cyclase